MTSASDKKEDFRRYLEKGRVLSVLTSALTDLFEMENKPDDPLLYLHQKFGENVAKPAAAAALNGAQPDAAMTDVINVTPAFPPSAAQGLDKPAAPAPAPAPASAPNHVQPAPATGSAPATGAAPLPSAASSELAPTPAPTGTPASEPAAAGLPPAAPSAIQATPSALSAPATPAASSGAAAVLLPQAALPQAVPQQMPGDAPAGAPAVPPSSGSGQ